METEADPRSSVFQSLGLSVSCMQIKIELDSGSHLGRETRTSRTGDSSSAQRQVPEGPRDTDAGAEAMLLRPQSRSRYAGAWGVSEMPGHLRNEGQSVGKIKRKSSLTSHEWTNNWKVNVKHNEETDKITSLKNYLPQGAVNC